MPRSSKRGTERPKRREAEGPWNGAGFLDMPAMGFLDDTQTASVLTYIRREWDHTAAPVTPETVWQLRDTTSTRTESSELLTGVWKDGRMGILHGLRKGPTPHRVIVFGSKAVVEQKVGASDYAPLVAEIVNFFQTGVPPVSAEETINMFAFMEAADESKRQGGRPVSIADVLAKATE